MNIIYRALTLFQIVWAKEYEFTTEDMSKKHLSVAGSKFT